MAGNNTKEIDRSIEWIFSKLRRPPFLWHLASSITIATVGFLSKVITGIVSIGIAMRKKSHFALSISMKFYAIA